MGRVGKEKLYATKGWSSNKDEPSKDKVEDVMEGLNRQKIWKTEDGNCLVRRAASEVCLDLEVE